MERTILKMIPVKSSCHFYFKDMGIMQCVGFKNKWVEDDESYMYGDGRCSIVYSSDLLYFQRSEHIFETLSDEELEDKIAKRNHEKEIAEKRANKTELARTLTRGVAYLAVATVKSQGHDGGKTTRTITEAVDSLYGINRNDYFFDEKSYREKWIRISGTNQWAQWAYTGKLYEEKWESVFRGVPHQYTGVKNPTCCITFQKDDTNYYINEYAGISEAIQAWDALKEVSESPWPADRQRDFVLR